MIRPVNTWRTRELVSLPLYPSASESEVMVYLTMLLRLMLTRLAKQNEKQFVTYKEKHAA
jgi:hypothetical protein